MRRFIVVLISVICFKNSFSEEPKSKNTNYSYEAVDYSLKYGIIKIGEAHVELNFDQKCSGAYIQAFAKSSGLFRFIKDIYYKYECCMDTATGLPVSDSRILIEGDYIDSNTVYYDHLSRKDSSIIYSKNTDTVVVPKNIYDLLSGFYHYRTNYLGDNLPLNHTFSTTTFFIDTIWDLRLRYCGKETINTNYGPIECLIVKPVTVIGHFFRTSDAMTMWFTNNGNHIPVKFSLDFKIGTLQGIITDYKSFDINNQLK